jgi:hypothetical protein
MTETHGAIVLFNAQKIRRTWYQGAWWFSVVDVAGALTESPDPGAYWRKVKQRLSEEESEVVTFCHGFPCRPALICCGNTVARAPLFWVGVHAVNRQPALALFFMFSISQMPAV